MRGASLELMGVDKSFGKTHVLDDVGFSVAGGRSLAILGPSGCGKSTVLRIIAGLLPQDGGRVMMDGDPVDGIPPNRRNVGFVFQDYSLFGHMSVSGNVEFGLRVRGKDRHLRREAVSELLSMVGLEGYQDRKPSQLSGGQKQRVALARALAVEPKLLLLDEPFSALDVIIRRQLRRDLKRLQKELGLTMLFVTHDQEEAFEMGDEIAVMSGGRIEQTGLPRDLYDNPRSPFVARFIGAMNVIRLPSCDDVGELDVMIRPEDIKISRVNGIQVNGSRMTSLFPHPDSSSAPKTSRGVGTIVNYTFLGPMIEVKLSLSNGDGLLLIMPKREFVQGRFRRGNRVRVRIERFRTFAV